MLITAFLGNLFTVPLILYIALVKKVRDSLPLLRLSPLQKMEALTCKLSLQQLTAKCQYITDEAHTLLMHKETSRETIEVVLKADAVSFSLGRYLENLLIEAEISIDDGLGREKAYAQIKTLIFKKFLREFQKELRIV